MNEILLEITKTIYLSVNPDAKPLAVEVLVLFDDLQRVSAINDLKVGDELKIPEFSLIEQLNSISTQLAELPKAQHLSSLKINIGTDMKMELQPSYMD